MMNDNHRMAIRCREGGYGAALKFGIYIAVGLTDVIDLIASIDPPLPPACVGAH